MIGAPVPGIDPDIVVNFLTDVNDGISLTFQLSTIKTLYLHCRGRRFDPWVGN